MTVVDRLTVVTYNIRAAIGLGPFPPAWWEHVDTDRLDRIAGIIADLAPDIVGLQEVPLMTIDGVVGDLAGELGRRLGMASRYGAVHHVAAIDRGSGSAIGAYTWGNAILSRSAITGSRVEALPVPADDDVVEPASAGDHGGVRYGDLEQGPREPRCALVVGTGAGADHVDVIAVHLAYLGSEQRRRQAERIAAIAAGLAGPVVLLGDLNAAIEAPELAPLRGPFSDAFLDLGVPPGDPRRRSCGGVAIDHVLVRGWRPVACRVVTEAGDASDHWPIVATLER